MAKKLEALDPAIFEAIVGTSNEPIGITDLATRLVYVNQAANQFFKVKDLTGKTLSEILPPGYRIELHDQVLATKKPGTKTVSGMGANGKPIEFEATAYPYPIDNTQFIIYRINKIEHHIKKELISTQSLYSKLIENMPDAVLIHKNNRITHANPAAVTLFKAGSASDLIGTDAIRLVHDESKATVRLRQQEAYSSPGHVSPTIEERLVTLEGDSFYAEASSTSVIIDDSLSMLIMIRDITKEKAYKEELENTNIKLEELNRNLEKRVEQELMRLREQEQILLQQSKLAAMGEMIGAIAHQWRQPLNALGLNIQDLLDAEVHGELDESYLKNLVSRSMQQIQYMSTTIDDFRNFFKSTKEKKRFNFVQTIHDVLSILSAQLKHHEIDVGIHVENDAADREILGYENELKQVLINLLNNAKDAIDESNQKEGRIDILIEREGDERISVTVSDNGSGIHPDIREKIFNPYFTTKEQGRGTGIGLYMSKTIIEQNMNGTLLLANDRNPTTFKITLPLVKL